MPQSGSGPNRNSAEDIARWESRLEELYALALEGERRWTTKAGDENRSWQADVKGALDVIRFALQLHGRIAPEQKAPHPESCGCARCTRFRTAENEVTAKVRQLREVAS